VLSSKPRFLPAWLAVEILYRKGYSVQDAAAWMLKDNYNLTDIFGTLVEYYVPRGWPPPKNTYPNTLTPVKIGTGRYGGYFDHTNYVVPVLKALSSEYDIVDLIKGDEAYNGGQPYVDLRDIGYSVRDAAAIVAKVGQWAVPDLIGEMEDDSINRANAFGDQSLRLSAQQIAAVLVYISVTTPGVSFGLTDIVKGLMDAGPNAGNAAAFTAKDVFEAVKIITGPYLNAIGSDASTDITALHLMKLAGLSADGAAAIEAAEGVGLSAGQIIMSFTGLSSPWLDAVQNLAAAGFSFSDSISAVYNNSDYHQVIGVTILSQIATFAISKLTESEMVVRAIKTYQRLDKLGFMVDDLVKGNYKAAAIKAGLFGASYIKF